MIEAFHIVAVATRDGIARAAEAAPASSAPGRLLRAVLAQYDGDVDRAVRQLRRLVAEGGPGTPYVADVLVPMLIMRNGRRDEIARLTDGLEAAGWAATAAAFRAFVAAEAGLRNEAQAHFEQASKLLDDEDDDVVRFRLEQRLARAAFYLHDYDAATRLAMASARGALRLEAWRACASAYSVLYNVHHNVTGDVAEANRYARLWRVAADRSNDMSFLYAALVAEYELAVQSADGPRIESLRTDIKRRLLPPQYGEHFALVFSEAIFQAPTDFRAFASLLQVLRDGSDRSRAQYALCSALVGVAHAALFNDAAARCEIRIAIERLGRTRTSDPAYERRYRRLARVAIAVACLLIGDDVRAQRTLRSSEFIAGQGEERLAVSSQDGATADVPHWQRGFARVLSAAFAARRNAQPPVPLTPAEFEVLRLLAVGYSARRIARDSGRSVNTIYNHMRAILAKFDVPRTLEAIAIARSIGMLT